MSSTDVTKVVQQAIEQPLVQIGVPGKVIRSILARVEHALEKLERGEAA